MAIRVPASQAQSFCLFLLPGTAWACHRCTLTGWMDTQDLSATRMQRRQVSPGPGAPEDDPALAAEGHSPTWFGSGRLEGAVEEGEEADRLEPEGCCQLAWGGGSLLTSAGSEGAKQDRNPGSSPVPPSRPPCLTCWDCSFEA